MHSNNASCGDVFLAGILTLFTRPQYEALHLHEDDQKQPLENGKGFLFFTSPTFPTNHCSLSLVFSGVQQFLGNMRKKQFESFPHQAKGKWMTHPPSRNVWKGISLFIWRKFGHENRLQLFPNLSTSCKLFIPTNFVEYLLHARKCELQDKSLYLLITAYMPNTVESTFYI